MKASCFKITIPGLIFFSLLTIKLPGQQVTADTNNPARQIISAVKSGDEAHYRELLASDPALLNTRDPEKDETLLHLAARNNRLSIATDLAGKGLDVNALNRLGSNPLHLAAFTGSYQLMELLIDAGADYTLRNSRGRTPAEYVSWGKNPEVFELFLKIDPDILGKKTTEGATLLHIAANAGDTAGFSYLLGKGLDPLLEANDGSNIVHWAMAGGDKTMLAWLDKKGFNYTLVSSRGFSPVVSAMIFKRQSSIEYLLESGIDIDQPLPPDGSTLLLMAMHQNSAEMVDYLLPKGAGIDVANEQGFTALCFSVLNRDAGLTTSLINKGADVNRMTAQGDTPLLLAIDRNDAALVELLLNSGANTMVTDDQGRSPLHKAVIMGNDTIVRLLLENDTDINLQDRLGLTPLHYASIYGRGKIAADLLASKADSRLFDLNRKDAPDYAAQYGNEKIFKMFVPAGQKVSTSKAEPGIKEKDEVQVHYLNHSSFAVETRNYLLVFDYFHYLAPPDEPGLRNGRINPTDFNGKEVFVFCSHEHSDHYDTTIWNWQAGNPAIHYIFGFKPEGKQNYVYAEPHKELNISGVIINAITSTDAGTGFLVEADGISVYHPGDHINKASGLAEDFKKEIDFLAGRMKKVDIAFFPVAGCGFPDLELVKEGNLYTIETLDPAVCFAMHADPSRCRDFTTIVAGRFPGKQSYYASFPGETFPYKQDKMAN